MANHVSALKRARQIDRRTNVNRARKSRLRHQMRALRRLLEQKEVAGAKELLPGTFSIIDRAARWGIIKPNAASRYKSRLHTHMKKLETAAA